MMRRWGGALIEQSESASTRPLLCGTTDVRGDRRFLIRRPAFRELKWTDQARRGDSESTARESFLAFATGKPAASINNC